jgi:hypothetical protein
MESRRKPSHLEQRQRLVASLLLWTLSLVNLPASYCLIGWTAGGAAGGALQKWYMMLDQTDKRSTEDGPPQHADEGYLFACYA